MTTLIQIDTSSKAAKAFLELAKELPFVTIADKESVYDPAFVKMILKAAKSKEKTIIDPADLWKSIGLK